MTQVIGFALGALHLDLVAVHGFGREPALVPEPHHLLGVAFEPGIGIQQRAMGRSID